jgi:uncharacterized membrane protein YeaQ/YmgE (transglycosylase-associated protein family)
MGATGVSNDHGAGARRAAWLARNSTHMILFHRDMSLINFVIWIVVGGLLGWVASKLMGTDGQQGTLLNIVVGIAGAFIAGLFISPLVGVGTINQGNFSIGALAVSLVGAVILHAIVNMLRRGSARRA